MSRLVRDREAGGRIRRPEILSGPQVVWSFVVCAQFLPKPRFKRER